MNKCRWLLMGTSLVVLVSLPACEMRPPLGPPTAETARGELRRLLDIWKESEFIIDGMRIKAKPGKDISRFFGHSMDSTDLISYEFLSTEETKPGEYLIKVSMQVKPVSWSASVLFHPDPETKETSYYVFRNNRNQWAVESTSARAYREDLFKN